MINESFVFSCMEKQFNDLREEKLRQWQHCRNSLLWSNKAFNLSNKFLLFLFFSADDDSDTNPHDFEGSDHDYGVNMGTHLNIGQHSFSQMQVRKCTSTNESTMKTKR